MNTWYLVKAKYTKQLEDGRLKRVTEPYLLDAASFTDAEARFYQEIGTNIIGDFVITGISKKDYSDIFYYEDTDDWYECKLSYIDYDERSGKEKQIKTNFLITANSVKESCDRIEESLADMTVSFDVLSSKITNIVEVLPYFEDLDRELERRPMDEVEQLAEVETPAEMGAGEEE